MPLFIDFLRAGCLFVLVMVPPQFTMLQAATPKHRTCEASTVEPIQIVHLPSAVVGRKYHSRQLIGDGSPPYTIAHTSWEPEPMGLALSADGVLSGVPVRPGTSTLTVVVRDARGCGSVFQQYQLRVLPTGAGQQ
jgi:Putative Ig domain